MICGGAGYTASRAALAMALQREDIVVADNLANGHPAHPFGLSWRCVRRLYLKSLE